MASDYQPTSNPCVFVKDGALYVKNASGEFEPYSYEIKIGVEELHRLVENAFKTGAGYGLARGLNRQTLNQELLNDAFQIWMKCFPILNR